MTLLERLQSWRGKKPPTVSSRHGALGEGAAKKHLQGAGLKFLTANFRTRRGELDLVFRDADCLLFVLFVRNLFLCQLWFVMKPQLAIRRGLNHRGWTWVMWSAWWKPSRHLILIPSN